jgi:hypothetical protein
MFRNIIELPVNLFLYAQEFSGLSQPEPVPVPVPVPMPMPEIEPNPVPVPETDHNYLPWIVVGATFALSAYTFLNAFYPIVWNQLSNLRMEDEDNGAGLVNEHPVGEKEEQKEEQIVIEEGVADQAISSDSRLFLGKLPLQTMFVEYTKACRENREASRIQFGEFELPFFSPANAMHPEERPVLILNMQKALGLINENGSPREITEHEASNVRLAFGYLG